MTRVQRGFAAGAARDLAFALRRMRRAPGLAVAIVLTLGLGLGAAAAIVAAARTALLDPLPYAAPERLVHLWEARVGTEERSPTSYATLLDWRSRARGFTALEGYDPINVTVGLGDEARMLRGARTTAGFFRLLGVPVAAGRDFLADEDAAAGAGTAIVSDRFARSLAGGALGRTVTINGTRHLVVGVLPGTFHFALLQNADVFVPLVTEGERRTDRTDRSIHVVGRLRDDVPVTTARAELAGVMSGLAAEYPDALAGRSVVAMGLRDALLGDVRPILLALLAAAALLLVIVGANLALLMLTRYLERLPELATRSALGATRARLLRQLAVESLVPTIAGAALATVVGQAVARALIGAIPEGVRIDMPYLSGVGLDTRAVLALVVLAALLAVGFALGPALVVSSTRMSDTRTTASRGDRRLRRGLVVAQTALTVVLLVASGLLVASFRRIAHRDLGIRDPESVVAARAPLSGPRYADDDAQRRFYENLLERSAALPGVRSVGMIDEVPGGGGGATTFDDVDVPRPPAAQPRATLRTVAGEYFATMGIPVIAGRAFDAHDRSNTPPVAVVSASFAKLLGGGGSPLGRRVRLSATDTTPWTVIGVVGDVQVAALDAESPPTVYLSQLQHAENRMTLVLRTGVGVPATTSELRAVVKELDPGVPVYAVTTLEQKLRDSKAVFDRRFPMILCGVFAAAALALTLVALYAVCMHDALTRRREFGIRLALGASPAELRRLVLRDAALLGVTGVGIGVVGAVLAARSIQAILYGIAASDWRVYGIVAAGVLAAACLASLRPALRAGSVDPSTIMREG